jgi:FecR protein
VSIPRFCSYLALPVLSFSLLTTPANASASPPEVVPPSDAASSETYDQIVRLSLVEGDVRISRGKEGEHATGGAWGEGVANLPIESGFSLVTGTGRAEIEFEDASTVYLGDNSVLVFNELTTTGGVPHSELTLVSGTATLHVQPTFPEETFILRTPAGLVTVRYGLPSFIRVNSYLDAMVITPREASTTLDSTGTKKTVKGQTITYYTDPKRVPEVSSDPGAFAEWDEWTAKREATRADALSKVMKDSGLTSPIPGLAEMNGQGTFFDCAPYGTCWQPTGGWGDPKGETGQLESQQVSYPSLRRSGPTLLRVSQTFQSSTPGAILQTKYEEPFPCAPGRVRRLISKDPLTGRETVLRTDYDFGGGAPYNWAVCHAGSWIHREHRYVWVAGTKRHHQCPVHWVRYGHSKAYVPIHPHDVPGRLPINLKHGVFQTSGRKGESVERVAFNPSTPVKVLNGTPKEFRAAYYPPLQRAEAPRLEAHLIKNGLVPGKNAIAKSPGTAITFNHKTQSFMVARQVTIGNRNTTVTEHFGGRGSNAQMHAGGGSSSGGSGSRGGGGSSGSHGTSGGSSGGGGGSHGSSGGGGGSSSGGSSGGGGGGGGGHR